MSSPQVRPKLSGKHGFQTRGAGDEREARAGGDGDEREARAGSDGEGKSLFSLRSRFPNNPFLQLQVKTRLELTLF